MSKPVKVYNKGTRPIVFERNRTVAKAIHPGKYVIFEPEVASGIVEKFENACTEEEFEKLKKDEAEKKEAALKEAKEESEKSQDEEAKKKAADLEKARDKAKKDTPKDSK